MSNLIGVEMEWTLFLQTYLILGCDMMIPGQPFGRTRDNLKRNSAFLGHRLTLVKFGLHIYNLAVIQGAYLHINFPLSNVICVR